MLKKIINEPLVHFLLAGFLLFVYFKSCTADNISGNTISVNKEAILNFMQFQSKAFNKKVFEEKLDQFSEKEKEQLIQNYVQDEVLYREALKLGLDQNDFVIQRRIIQKMEFILDDFDESSITVSEDSIQGYYAKHEERYFHPEQYTFTHIFFKDNEEGKALERAVSFMKTEQHQHLAAGESLPYGDRFLYHRNYSEKDKSFLYSQFGANFTAALASMQPSEDRWQGPIQSDHGQHWVKLLDKTEASVADLEEVSTVVRADYIAYLKQEHKQKQIERLIATYSININL